MRRAQRALHGYLRMNRGAPWLLGALLTLAGCVPPYKPPTADQPHAIVKLRRSYDTAPGVTLSEVVEIDDHSALEQQSPASIATTARVDSVLTHPVPSSFSFRSRFFHTETRLIHESYQEPHTTYDSESYDCSSGSGTTKTYRTCTRTVAHTHYETRYRTVWRRVEVTDGDCASALRFAPRDGRVYLLQYTYQAHSVCSLSCFEQVPQEAGAFTNVECPAAPPAEK